MNIDTRYEESLIYDGTFTSCRVKFYCGNEAYNARASALERETERERERHEGLSARESHRFLPVARYNGRPVAEGTARPMYREYDPAGSCPSMCLTVESIHHDS